MYSKEYKNWITCNKNKSLPLNKMIDSVKEYWSGASALVNQEVAAPALQHHLGYNEHAILCSINRTLFFLHKQNLLINFLFLKKVDVIPDFSACKSDNKCESLKATHTRNQKIRADIITMNLALAFVFLVNVPKAFHKTYKPIRMKNLNTVFLYMFDREANWQRMAIGCHSADGFEPLAPCLFIGASYAGAAQYLMRDCDVIDICLCIIKAAECTPKVQKLDRS